jgi:capsular polysaccharide transport system permease protein
MFIARPPLVITFSVWKALFLREAITRIWSSRTAWVWLLLEPVAHVAYLMFIYTVIRVRNIEGMETPVWIMVGITAYFMFKRTVNQTDKAIGSNKSLFAYRQVKPVDCVIARAFLEMTLMTVIIIVLFSATRFYGLDSVPADPAALMIAYLGMWMIGLGFGLICSVATELVPEIGRVLSLLMMPLYLISGVIFPVAAVPPPYRDWLLWNPLLHGVSAARSAVAPYYHTVPGVDVGYLFAFALVMVFFGLALHRRFSMQMVMK